MKLPVISSKIPLIVLRVITGLIFITHGLARLYYKSVSDFGNYLESLGFPVGEFLAWVITIGEILSGTLLIAGILIKYAVVFHTIILLTGILILHIHHGWFVVGHGANGVEYSLLLLAVLVLIYSKEK